MTMNITRLDSTADDFEASLSTLLEWQNSEDASVDGIVREIIAQVRKQGDRALLEYTARFDRLQCDSVDMLRLRESDFSQALERIDVAERDALQEAAERIRLYHEHQLAGDWSFVDELGNTLGQKVTPLDRVGVYVPGGQAVYPSTVLMTVIPAKVAGVSDILLTVPTPDGHRNDLLLAAACIAGADQGFTIGGAQAVAALAFGTETIPKVDKIVGPGGVYVAAAKRQVFGEVGIDLIAGPSEVLIIADGTTPVEWIAYDLFSQAEHDAAAQALLLCPDVEYLNTVFETMQRLLPDQLRRETITRSLADRGGLILTRDLDESLHLANRIAPEHLELCIAEPERALSSVRNAGAIFVGAHSPEVMGDYVAGPSHVLPTYGTARFSSALGVYDFQKRSSVIQLSREGAVQIARTAATLAHGEGLQAHAKAAEARIPNMDHNKPG